MLRKTAGLICFVFLVLTLGCAGSRAQEKLLEQDYHQMSDDQLLDYYFALDEEIDRCEHAGNRGSIGLGTGTRGGNIGFGIGVTKGLTGCNPGELLERRHQVREELQRKNLLP
ncbi:MAG: hypothetical protein ACLFQR_06870 [Desulfovibrionales bacterium]